MGHQILHTEHIAGEAVLTPRSMTRRFQTLQQGFQIWEGIGLTPSSLPLAWSTKGSSSAKGCEVLSGQQPGSTEMHSSLPPSHFRTLHKCKNYILNRLRAGKISVLFDQLSSFGPCLEPVNDMRKGAQSGFKRLWRNQGTCLKSEVQLCH